MSLTINNIYYDLHYILQDEESLAYQHNSGFLQDLKSLPDLTDNISTSQKAAKQASLAISIDNGLVTGLGQFEGRLFE